MAFIDSAFLPTERTAVASTDILSWQVIGSYTSVALQFSSYEYQTFLWEFQVNQKFYIGSE